jgi:hypothetical protein
LQSASGGLRRLVVEDPAWLGDTTSGNRKATRGAGIVPLIPTAATVLDEHLAETKVQNFIFETLDGEPGALDCTNSASPTL